MILDANLTNEALPQPISKRKDKEHKEKKSKAVSALNVTEAEVGALKTANALPEVASYNVIAPANTGGVLDEKP
ncbi:period circadian protein, partial [Lasius niger]